MLGYERGEFEALKNQNAALALLASPTLLSSDAGPPARLQPELRVVFGKGALMSALQYESSVYHLGPAGCATTLSLYAHSIASPFTTELRDDRSGRSASKN